LTGCGAHTGRHVDEAAARIGAVKAGTERVRQPEECRTAWPLLDRSQIVGREKLVVIDKYEAYITDTINPAKRRCWQFNETVNAGLADADVGR
jgi:hypothetical protein